MTDQFQVRRLSLPDEFEQIIELQKNAPEFLDHYPHHSEWLEMAISEINEGQRVAFGLKKPVYSGSSLSQKLVGSIIIKKGAYSQVVELKNMYVRPEDRGNGWGKHLYNEVEQYCRRKGYSSIETEVPYSEIGTVNFLHGNGYRIAKSLESRFKKGDHVYVMEKSIYPSYGGDPFDMSSICEWFAEKFWGLSHQSHREGWAVYESAPSDRFIDYLPCDYSNLSIGIAYVDESNGGDLENSISNLRGVDLLVVFSNSPNAFGMNFGNRSHKIVDAEQVTKTMTGHLGYSIPNFKKSEIAGMIVAFNPVIFEKLNDANEPIPYYKGGPIGQYVQPGQKAFLFSEGDEELPLGGIKAVAEIGRVMIDQPDKVRTAFADYESLISDSEFKRFFQMKQTIVGLTLTNIDMVKPIDENRIYEILGQPPETDLSEIGHRYVSHSEAEQMQSTIQSDSTLPKRQDSGSRSHRIADAFGTDSS